MSQPTRESIDDRDKPIHAVNLHSPLHLVSPQTPSPTTNLVKKTHTTTTTTPKFKSFQSDANTKHHLSSFQCLFSADDQSKDITRASLYKDALDHRRWCEMVNRFRFCDDFDFIVKSISRLYYCEHPQGSIIYGSKLSQPLSQEAKQQIFQLFKSMLIDLKESSEIQFKEITNEIERIKYQSPPSASIQQLIRRKVQLKIFQKLLENHGVSLEIDHSDYINIIYNKHIISNSLKEIKSTLLSQFNTQLVLDGVEFKRKTTAASSAVFRLEHPPSQFPVSNLLAYYFGAIPSDPALDRRFFVYSSATKDEPSVDAKPVGVTENSFFFIGWNSNYIPPTRVKQLSGVSLHLVSYLPFCRSCRSTLHTSCSLLNSIPKKRKK